ncbi:hypothetical protein ACHAQJ_000448 [Trichoderma viride]
MSDPPLCAYKLGRGYQVHPHPKYTLRYPTPQGHSSDYRTVVAGKFSLKEMHKAIVLFTYLALYRRTAASVNIHTKRVPTSQDSFLRYFNVETQKPIFSKDKEAGPTQAACMRSLENPLPLLDYADDDADITMANPITPVKQKNAPTTPSKTPQKPTDER